MEVLFEQTTLNTQKYSLSIMFFPVNSLNKALEPSIFIYVKLKQIG